MSKVIDLSKIATKLPLALVLLVILWLASSLRSEPQAGFDAASFAKIPVLSGGRIKPIDTVARTSLLMLSGKQTLRVDERSVSASAWLLDMLFQPDKADSYNVFRIDEPEVLGLIGIQQQTQTTFPFKTLAPFTAEIGKQADRAEMVESVNRSLFQTGVINLRNKLELYFRLQHSARPLVGQNAVKTLITFEEDLGTNEHSPQSAPQSSPEAQRRQAVLQQFQRSAGQAEFRPLPPPAPGAGWLPIAEGLSARLKYGKMPLGLLSFAQMADACRADSAADFNKAVSDYLSALTLNLPQVVSHAGSEEIFNRFEPFYKSMLIYVVVFLAVSLYWLFRSNVLNRSAFALLLLAFAVHTSGLFLRIVLQGRPPVTNLYSSAVFVGWGAVCLGILLEWIFRTGVGSAVAAAVGFITLIIAHHLALQGDTMEMMRAVLDSNFWLATHVVCITIGYSSMFISGAVGIVYLVRRAFDLGWSDEAQSVLSRMVYGIVCFSAVFTFVGTVLGGIWADQSWGRFWGWDPKENGAMLIVLWTIMILHARAGKIAGEKGVMMMAVCGNIITAGAWFGVNMLNVGLHSYGYMDKAFDWLVIFVCSQLLIMALGFVPERALRLARLRTARSS